MTTTCERDTLLPMPRPQPPPPVLEPETGCLLWQGSISKNGYPRVSKDGRQQMAHRVAYEEQVGPIPAGLDLDHVWERGCRYRHCVNVEHLEPVTRAENLRRAGARLEQCPAGHAYTLENTYVGTNGFTRFCRACHRERQRARYHRLKGTP